MSSSFLIILISSWYEDSFCCSLWSEKMRRRGTDLEKSQQTTNIWKHLSKNHNSNCLVIDPDEVLNTFQKGNAWTQYYGDILVVCHLCGPWQIFLIPSNLMFTASNWVKHVQLRKCDRYLLIYVVQFFFMIMFGHMFPG